MEINYENGAPEALWKAKVYPVYVFTGEEDRLKEEAASALVGQVISKDFEDFDLETIDGSTAGAETILSAAGQVPFGSDFRVVLVKGMERWRDRSKTSEVERLAEGVLKLGNSSVLILMVSAEEEESKRKTGITVKLDNAVKKVGALVFFRALQGASLTRWIVQRSAREGKQFEMAAAELLVQSIGSDMLPLEQEIIKLVCYVGDRPVITSSDVGMVTASSPEDVVFTVIDAITRRQTDRALSLLAELHRFDPKPQAVAGKLLALLARQYRMLWQAKYLAEAKVSPRELRSLPPDIADHLPGDGNIAQLAFKAPDLFTQSKGYSWRQLRQALDLLLICDLANKGGVTDEIGIFGANPAANLQLLTLSLTSAGN